MPKWFKFYQKVSHRTPTHRIAKGELKYTISFDTEPLIISVDTDKKHPWGDDPTRILCVDEDGLIVQGQEDPDRRAYFLATVWNATSDQGECVWDIITDGDEYAYIYYPKNQMWYHIAHAQHPGYVSDARCPFASTLCTYHQAAIQELLIKISEEIYDDAE